MCDSGLYTCEASKYETKIFEKALFIFAGKCNGIDYVSDV